MPKKKKPDTIGPVRTGQLADNSDSSGSWWDPSGRRSKQKGSSAKIKKQLKKPMKDRYKS